MNDKPTTYWTLRELAARWRCTPETARQRTHRYGFPQPLAFSTRHLLWAAAEVEAWETSARALTQPKRRVTTRPSWVKVSA